MKWIASRCWLASSIISVGLSAHAATLQISPVMVDLQANENAAGITLRNPGDQPLYGQVRVFRWDQANGDDTLTPTGDVVASPPLVQIAGQADQLVRLVQIAHAAPTQPPAEASYRIMIDELPQANAAPATGVQVRLRYSVPVFIEPAGAPGQPKLSWHMMHDGQGWILSVNNTGAKHAQIARVRVVSQAGKVYDINPGLLGYALAERTRQWQVPIPLDADLSGKVTVQASVNSEPIVATVTMDPRN